MMFLGMFKGDLQKIVKKRSKFVPPGPKNNDFWPFLDLKIIPTVCKQKVY